MKKLFVTSLALGGILIAGNALADDYYEFSVYDTPGYTGYDVACFGNDIYYGRGTSVFKTTVSVADVSLKDEPRFLADGVTPNPSYQIRTFTAPTSITLGSSVNGTGGGELYVDSTYIYRTSGNDVKQFNKSDGTYVATVVDATSGIGYANYLSYGGGKWWSGSGRDVFSFSAGDSAWTQEFTWSNMAGGHGDGMEYVNGFVFVSDMTSNFLAQWGQGDNPDTLEIETGWTEWNRFAYTEIGGTNKVLEGMGFGALGHFWGGAGTSIYELGGGEIQIIIDDPPEVPEPSTVLLMGVGLASLVGYSRKKKGLKK